MPIYKKVAIPEILRTLDLKNQGKSNGFAKVFFCLDRF